MAPTPARTCRVHIGRRLWDGPGSRRSLRAEGARIAVADIREPDAKETANQIVADGGEAIVLHVDVTSDLEVKAAAEATLARFGGLTSCSPAPEWQLHSSQSRDSPWINGST